MAVPAASPLVCPPGSVDTCGIGQAEPHYNLDLAEGRPPFQGLEVAEMPIQPAILSSLRGRSVFRISVCRHDMPSTTYLTYLRT